MPLWYTCYDTYAMKPFHDTDINIQVASQFGTTYSYYNVGYVVMDTQTPYLHVKQKKPRPKRTVKLSSPLAMKLVSSKPSSARAKVNGVGALNQMEIQSGGLSIAKKRHTITRISASNTGVRKIQTY